jgi:hypothetical protein
MYNKVKQIKEGTRPQASAEPTMSAVPDKGKAYMGDFIRGRYDGDSEWLRITSKIAGHWFGDVGEHLHKQGMGQYISPTETINFVGGLIGNRWAKGFRASDVTKRWKGPDTEPRFYIPDSGLKVSGEQLYVGNPRKLGDIAQWDEAFENYPWLKNSKLYLDPNIPKGWKGYALGKNIYANPEYISRQPKSLLDIITHETNHVVQDRTGLAEGINPAAFTPDIIKRMASGRWQGNTPPSAYKAYLNTYGEAESRGMELMRALGKISKGEVNDLSNDMHREVNRLKMFLQRKGKEVTPDQDFQTVLDYELLDDVPVSIVNDNKIIDTVSKARALGPMKGN